MAWEFENGRPIYTQLLEKIQLMIISGKYNPGDRLPSVRDLAAEAAVNPNTMQRALQELERQGLVFTQRTAGRMITEDAGLIAGIKESVAMEHIEDFIKTMEELGFNKQEIIKLLTQMCESE